MSEIETLKLRLKAIDTQAHPEAARKIEQQIAELQSTRPIMVFPATLYSPPGGAEPPVSYQTLSDGWRQFVVSSPAELRSVTAAIERHWRESNQPIIINFDGAYENNVASWGYVITGNEKTLDLGSGVTAGSTNNIAEYAGLIAGLKAAVKLDIKTPVTVRGDSQLVIYQMTGKYQVKAAHLKKLHREATELAQQLSSITFEWIPREENRKADMLSKSYGQPSFAGTFDQN